MTIHLEVHTLKVTLYDMRSEVSHRTCGVCLYHSLGILYHVHTILVIGIGYGKGILWQVIEELLLGIAIVFYRLVIVQVVTSEIGKQTTSKLQSSYAFLCYSMTGALHKGILTASLNHLGKKHVEFDGVRGSMVGRICLTIDIVAYGGQQSTLMSHLAKHII